MLPDGMHVAIAAWIDARRTYPGFLSVPPRPLPIQPSLLEALVTRQNPAVEADFALMANFVPRRGRPAEPYGPARALWIVHRETLAGMRFALEPLTPEEAAALARARALLYPPDASGRPAISEKLLAYREMKAVVDRLELDRRPADEIEQAYADWLVLGFKSEVESALALLARLARRSSVDDAVRERGDLAEEALPRAGEVSFAPTYFAPLAAVQEATWARNAVSFSELRAAVPGELTGLGGTFLSSQAEGTCEFGHTVLELGRPWFSASLYEADDWRLAPGEIVSDGFGGAGRMPGYVQSVYVVRPQAGGGKGVSGPSRPIVARPPVDGPAFPRPGVVGGLRPGVMGGPLPRVDRPPVVIGPPRPVSWGSPVLRRADWIEQIDRIRKLARLGTATPVPSAPSECLVVGFGCAQLPSSPRPNPAYTW
ncbi:hypothetical protein GCM10010176_036460 [Nonomuraea spiralis]|nr:hypothetical protein GCM10010176_036460 [Nonomuraea spiralis]